MTMTNRLLGLLLFAVLLVFAPSAFAVDGVILINQNTSVNGLPGCAHSGFPITICQSGSYKLSGNLVVPANQNGVNISADNVLLDLNGFTISGPGTCNGSPHGNNPQPATSCSGNSSFVQGILTFGNNVTVRNGSVRGMSVGVDGGALVEEIQSTNNLITGIQIGFGIVRRCLADNNGGAGIQVIKGLAESNEASLNGAGLHAEEAVVLGNALNYNSYGLLAYNGVLYGSNSIRGNAVVDVFVTSNATVTVSQNNNICTAGKC